MTSNHLWSVHWQPLHRAGTDKQTFADWRPPFVKLVWDGAQVPYLEDIPADARIVWRNYPLSEGFHGGLNLRQPTRALEALARLAEAAELPAAGALPQNGSGRDRVATRRAFETNATLPTPEEAAAAYLKNAEEIIAYCASRGVDRKRLIFEGPNEYPVWAHGYAGLARLERARLHGLQKLGTGGCYGNLGVGWPGNTGKDTPPVWDWFKPVADDFGPRDFLGAHEYSGRNGPRENWGWWLGRILKCPFRVPFLITECGIDLGVHGPDSAKQGWLNCWPGASLDDKARNYIAELGEYEDAMRADGRAAGLFPYTYDGNRDDWGMFSIDMEVFLKQWLPWLRSRPAVTKPPVTPQPEPKPEPPPPASDPVWEAVKAAFGAQCYDARAQLETKGSYAARARSAVKRVVVHHSAAQPTVSWAAIARYHVRSRGWPGIGYHFGITPDGGLTYVGAVETLRYHAGNANGDSIGVCFAGDYREIEPTAASVATCRQLVAVLETVLGHKLGIVGHKDVMDTACPGARLYAAVVTADDLGAALKAAGQSHDLTRRNPATALYRAIVAAGAVPASEEFRLLHEGVEYACQWGAKTGEGSKLYCCVVGQWEEVTVF